MLTTRMVARAFAGLLVLLTCTAARADQWMLPKAKQYTSADQHTRVTVTPRPLESQLAFFQDKADGKEQAGQRAGDPKREPTAVIEQQDAQGQWRTVHSFPLINDVAPVTALVTNGGRYVVTFDNWHSMGYGDDVVVIYRADGHVIKKFGLKNLVSPAYIAAMPRTVSSLWWGVRDHILVDDTTVELHLAVPGSRPSGENAPFVPMRIRLTDGVVLPNSDARWAAAMRKVGTLEQTRTNQWNALRARRAAPLSPPSGNDPTVWREYMGELRTRLSDGTERVYSGHVLQTARGDSSTEDPLGIGWGLDKYAEETEHFNSDFLFVSPDDGKLADFLATRLARYKPNAMRGAHIYFLGTARELQAVRGAAKKSGAVVELIDRAVPVPGQTLPEEVPEWFIVMAH